MKKDKNIGLNRGFGKPNNSWLGRQVLFQTFNDGSRAHDVDKEISEIHELLSDEVGE